MRQTERDREIRGVAEQSYDQLDGEWGEWLAVARKYEGDIVQLKDTIADDKAIDLEAWLDEATWRLGCPMRLVEIARKRLYGIPLDNKDKCYLWRFRKQEQKKLF